MKKFLPRRWLISLLIFTSLHAIIAAAADHNYFNVHDYGAVGDGSHLDSPAINQAIVAAAAAGGGTVYFAAGTYLSGSIHLKSNVHLLIDAGAVILAAPQNLNAYDQTEPFMPPAYQDGGHTYFHNSLIWGENLTNVSITGSGMINGGNLSRWDSLLDKMAGCAPEGKLQPQLGATNATPLPNSGMPPVRIGNKAIALKQCNNVLIRDVTILYGGHFAILVTGCDNVTIDNVRIDTNRDGMDIDCCENVMVSNCGVNSPNDDGICLKSTYALGKPRLTENVTIVNCQVSGFQEGTLLNGTMKPAEDGVGRIKFGTESSGGFRNCAIANCTFRNCKGLALEEVDGGIFENITVCNLSMSNVKHYAIYLTTGKRNRTPHLTTVSRMKNVLISNVIADGVDPTAGIIITGLPEQPLEGIRLENIRLISEGGGTKQDAAKIPRELGADYPEPHGEILPAYGVFARHVRDLELANLTLKFRKTDFRPAMQFADIDGLELDNLKAQVADGVRVAEFSADLRGLAIYNSPALENLK